MLLSDSPVRMGDNVNLEYCVLLTENIHVSSVSRETGPITVILVCFEWCNRSVDVFPAVTQSENTNQERGLKTGLKAPSVSTDVYCFAIV